MTSWAAGKLLGFDIESTGVDPLNDVPVSFALAHVDAGALVKGRSGLINPGVPIPPATTEIHGITDEMVAARGGDLTRSIYGIVKELLAASASEVPVVGCNLRFDLTIIDSCLRRMNGGGGGLAEAGWIGPVIDILVIDRGVDRYRKGKRTLTALCQHYGVELSEAHAATADTTASIQVAHAIAVRYPEVGEMNLTQLHNRQAGWHHDWAESFSKYRVSQGGEPLASAEFLWPL